jgi:hypothetical protein
MWQRQLKYPVDLHCTGCQLEANGGDCTSGASEIMETHQEGYAGFNSHRRIISGKELPPITEKPW